jgi:hypothetical protein
MPRSKGLVSTTLGILFIIAVISWTIKGPDEAAQFADSAIALFQRVIEGLLQFFDDIAQHNT